MHTKTLFRIHIQVILGRCVYKTAISYAYNCPKTCLPSILLKKKDEYLGEILKLCIHSQTLKIPEPYGSAYTPFC